MTVFIKMVTIDFVIQSIISQMHFLQKYVRLIEQISFEIGFLGPLQQIRISAHAILRCQVHKSDGGCFPVLQYL